MVDENIPVKSEAALLQLMNRTGYTIIQENGQRKFGGPPPGWEGKHPPPRGCEVFIGKIPRDLFEDELVPVLEKIGPIYELRLMMDFSGSNRGYAFCMFTNRDDAQKAVKQLNNYEIRKGRYLGVCPSIDNCRLFVGGIPKNKMREEIMSEMTKVTDGVVDVIVYPSATDKSKNRGFAFVEYESHRAAAMARRKLIPGKIQLWGHHIMVDWAEPEREVEAEVMQQVKVLYVRNLMLSTTEETIRERFNEVRDGAVERVKKMRDFAFVHFTTRDDAIHAMEMLDGTILDKSKIEVTLAKPPDKSWSNFYGYQRPGLQQYSPTAYVYDPYYPPGYMNMCPPPTAAGRGGIPPPGRGSPPLPLRGALRGRATRGAAGLRGGGRAYVPLGKGAYQAQKHPTEVRLYDLLPGTELVPTNPHTLRPQTMKSPVQVLDEFCQKNNWGVPQFHLFSTNQPSAAGDSLLFVFKVIVPGFSLQPFMPTKLCKTVEEAKTYASEFVLNQLGLNVEGQNTTSVVESDDFNRLPDDFSLGGLPSQLSNLALSSPMGGPPPPAMPPKLSAFHSTPNPSATATSSTHLPVNSGHSLSSMLSQLNIPMAMSSASPYQNQPPPLPVNSSFQQHESNTYFRHLTS